MSMFVDSSAFVALLDRDDPRHDHARDTWTSLVTDEVDLVTTNYVVLETTAVVQRLLGLDAVCEFHASLMAPVQMHWIDQETQASALTMLLAARRRTLSLVDCTSFEAMRRLGIADVFAFDRHFKDQGFTVMP